jgi:predicted metal-dependent peptidase
MSDMSKKFAKGRAGLILDQPFFGSLALRLKTEEDPTCETAWVDGTTLGFNPEFIDSLSLDELKGLICHEVMHCGLQHHTRRGDRDPERWNMAGDYVINPLIVDSGMKLPEGGALDDRFRDKTAEQVYSLLPAPEPKDPQDGGSGKGNGDGKKKSHDPGKCGEVRDAKAEDGKSPAGEADKSKASQDWKVAMAQAAQQARASGNLPGSMARVIENILEPKLDWREILRRFVDTCSKNDYSWGRPNRRWIGRGIYLPALSSNELGSVVAAVDTSGSIGQEQLDQFAGEINAILQDYQADCTVIYCDTQVNKVDEFPAGDTVVLKVHGGGGTDFRPPFDLIDDQGKLPVCMLYFTDGECNQFPVAPAFPVLWVQKKYYAGEWDFTPPFGEVLELR